MVTEEELGFCPTCGMALKNRVLIPVIDSQSREVIDLFCCPTEVWYPFLDACRKSETSPTELFNAYLEWVVIKKKTKDYGAFLKNFWRHKINEEET